MFLNNFIFSNHLVQPVQAVQNGLKKPNNGLVGQQENNLVHSETLTNSISGQSGQGGQVQLNKKIQHNALGIARRKMYTALFWMRFASNQKLGTLGEMYVNYWLQAQGYHSKDTSHLTHKGDVTATLPDTGEIIHFEVKTAKRGLDDRWQFCLRKKGKTNIAHSDYVVFLLLDDHLKLFRYIVPSALLGTSCKLSLKSHPNKYRGKIAPFLQRTDDINITDIQATYQLIGD